MLIFCWIFLFIEARDFNILGCVHKDPGWSYRAISDEEFVLPCAFPSQSHGQIFDNLYQHRSEVKWFWQSKGGGLLKSIGSESTNPILQGNALWFKPIRVNDSGLFICTIREEDSCLKINVEVQTKEMANCLNYGPNEQYLFIQTGDSILCPGKKCYRLLQRSQVTWYKNGKLVKDSRTSLKLEEDKITLHHVYAVDAGTYVCDYILFDDSRQWTMRTIVEVKTITKDTIHTPTILEPSGVKTFEVELGKPLELKCKVFFSFERNVSSLIMLYRENNKSKNK
uniref:Ig-like domain-containing protein n=1 Tax=Sphenodon punctatus TaxID=8508 RepID=A0A8D0GF31_SPHPU